MEYLTFVKGLNIFSGMSSGDVLACVIIGIIALVVGLIIAFPVGVAYRRRVAEAELGSAEEEARRIVNESIKTAESRKKEALVEAKDEIHKLRTDAEREVKDRRAEVQRQEHRLQQKEESLDKKADNLDKKEEQIQEKLKAAETRLSEAEQIKKSQFDMLERISGYTEEQAKAQLLSDLDAKLSHEKALRIMQYEQQYKDESEEKAREILGTVLARCAPDYVAEATVSVVPLPGDEMKGRIIGREGRNIRAIETITGVDLIIDDTPEAIAISCFDPVRREIARLSLEKLIQDGRIHPARIEEMVDKVKKEVDGLIKEAGENAVFECGIYGIHPELIKILGKLKYRTSYGQNVLPHSLEVAFLAGVMASELGADVKAAKRAGLLHDIGKAVDHEIEGTHVQIGVDLLKKYKESAAVIHAVAAHHGDIEATSVEAVLVQAADAISSARPGARRESLENYVKRIEKLETIANSFNGVEQSYAIQAGREIRVMVKPEVVDDTTTVFLAKEIANKLEAELEYPGQIKVTVVREIRSVDYAK